MTELSISMQEAWSFKQARAYAGVQHLNTGLGLFKQETVDQMVKEYHLATGFIKMWS